MVTKGMLVSVVCDGRATNASPLASDSSASGAALRLVDTHLDMSDIMPMQSMS